jgi:signal transduction histidine kinase
MNPTAPEWTDLAGGLERFTGDFASQWGMNVDYVAEGTAREVDSDLIAVVFGFVQEALTNVRKHAESAHTQVTLVFEDSGIAVTVEDDGPGFDTEGGEETGFRLHQGLGLTRSRINLAGGRFSVRSKPGTGTTLKLEIAG